MTSNGQSGQTNKSFPPGIHGPSVTFFKDGEQQEIDWAVQEQHLEYMISSGMHGVVLAGSSGESATLNSEEKAQLVRKTREIANAKGKRDFTITIGCLAPSTREIINQTVAGHQNGADFALVLVPALFHWAMTKKAIVDFFQEVGDRSPIPVMIYNFPNLLSGLDVDSDMLETLGSHPNICGVKLTCGGVGKIPRLTTQYSSSQFAAVCGQSDWLAPALSAGAAGCISGVANLFPQVMLEIYNLHNAGKLSEATELQKKLTQPEWGIGTSDVNGMKWIIAKQHGYNTNADCRRPFPKFVDPEKQARVVRLVAPLVPVEEQLRSKA